MKQRLDVLTIGQKTYLCNYLCTLFCCECLKGLVARPELQPDPASSGQLVPIVAVSPIQQSLIASAVTLLKIHLFGGWRIGGNCSLSVLCGI